MKAIQDNDRLYNLLSPLVQYACRCHYNSFVVRGTENLPSDGAYIIAPCHQQALMEPLAVLNFAPVAPVFLARADLFRKPLLRKALTFLKIMPVYRIRDGIDSLGQNKEIFDRCCDVLTAGHPLCLMAEGRHNNKHRLLPLLKGMFRIAGEAQERLGDKPLYIVPTGIDFDDYERPYSNLVVKIGRPIAVQPFMDSYRTDTPHALNHMRDALHNALLPLMFDIRSEEHYDSILTICNAMNRDFRRRQGLKNNAWNRFRMRQAIARRLEKETQSADSGEFSRLMALGSELSALCRRLRLDAATLGEHRSLPALLLVLAALVAALLAVGLCRPLRLAALFCLLCYPLPLIPTHLIVRRKVADPQFRSSFNFGVRFLLSLVYALAIGVVAAATGGLWMSGLADLGAWWGLVAVAIVVVGAGVSGPCIAFLFRLASDCRFWLLHISKPATMKNIDTIISSISRSLNK